ETYSATLFKHTLAHSLKIKHNFDCITAASADLKSFLNLLLREPKPMTEVRGTVISLWPIPIRQTLPPARVALRAVDIVLLKPAQSKLTDFATERRHSSTSTIMILGAPNARAASIVTKPIGPAPMISTFFSGPISARRQAWIPTLRGSHIAPSSKLTLSGSLKHKSAGCTT
ncbi:hypothetical protein ACMD2_15562, partial [Ananas comosus]